MPAMKATAPQIFQSNAFAIIIALIIVLGPTVAAYVFVQKILPVSEEERAVAATAENALVIYQTRGKQRYLMPDNSLITATTYFSQRDTFRPKFITDNPVDQRYYRDKLTAYHKIGAALGFSPEQPIYIYHYPPRIEQGEASYTLRYVNQRVANGYIPLTAQERKLLGIKP